MTDTGTSFRRRKGIARAQAAATGAALTDTLVLVFGLNDGSLDAARIGGHVSGMDRLRHLLGRTVRNLAAALAVSLDCRPRWQRCYVTAVTTTSQTSSTASQQPALAGAHGEAPTRPPSLGGERTLVGVIIAPPPLPPGHNAGHAKWDGRFTEPIKSA